MLVGFGFSATVKAQNFTIADIIVDGYQRISPGIIYNLLPVGIGDEVTATTPAEIIRSLTGSDYFDEIDTPNLFIIRLIYVPSSNNLFF